MTDLPLPFDPTAPKELPKPTCSVTGCAKPIHVLVHGLCNSHYLRKLRHGDPLASAPKKMAAGRGVGFGFASCANEHCDRTAIISLPNAEAIVCNKHYQAAINGKDWRRPDKARAPDGMCQVAGCTKPVVSGHKFQCSAHYARERRHSPLGQQPVQPPCANCGAALERNQSKFCSSQCQWTSYRKDLKARLSNLDGSHRRRAIAHDAPYEKRVDLFAVIERDGWRCYICKEAIGADLRFPHPMSLSIDHEHALAAGGGHTFANCRATHKQCNFQKAYDQDIGLAAKSRRLRGLSGQRARRERRGESSIKAPAVSGLSKDARGYVKRKIVSRGFK